MLTATKTAVLLTNLGTPSAPTTKAVRHYLAEFLTDPYVVQIPRPIWLPILHGLVLRLRPKHSAKLYQKIWTADGSPLLVNSQKLSRGLESKLNKIDPSITVSLGMRYGTPSINQVLANLKQLEPQRLIIFPLYPQYSASTTASTFEVINKALKTWRYIPEVRFISNYHQESSYISAWITQILNTLTPNPLATLRFQLRLQAQPAHPCAGVRREKAIAFSFPPHPLAKSCSGRGEQQIYSTLQKNQHLLFSFHGLPQRVVDAGDPYQQQCRTTAQAIANSLQLEPNQWSIAFQSRFGRAKWLQPYCDKTLQELPKQGKKNVIVACPGFAVDCLETLEEINMQNRKIFLEAGGESFTYIPALNDSELHVELLAKIILQRLNH